MPHETITPNAATALVTGAKQALADARRRKADAERQAELAYDFETAEHHQLLSDLVSEYGERAFELAEDEAPVSRSRIPLRPTEVTATPDGIELWWDADWPASPVTHTVSWAELMSKETSHADC